jgi:alpha-mannosidase
MNSVNPPVKSSIHAAASGRWIALFILIALSLGVPDSSAGFTPLTLLPAPELVRSAEAYPGGSFEARHLLDGLPKTEFASNGKGTNTFVELRFPQTVRVGAFRHVDRNDPATVAASELVFLDADGRVTGTVAVPHVNQRGGETFFVFLNPVSGQVVRWRVTKLGPQGYGTVGGAELSFFAAGDPQPAPNQDRLEVQVMPFLEKNAGPGVQPVRVSVSHLYAEPARAVLRVTGEEPLSLDLKPGPNTVEIKLPAAEFQARNLVSLEVEGTRVAALELVRKPVQPLTIYVLPHSHTDIGYTEIQTAIEKKQVQNLVDGIAHARRTASYPEGARFVWNVEVAWAADLYLHRLNEQQRADFMEAVKKGQVVLCGMYLNELTGLCRPEELIQLFRYATELAQETGRPIDSVMISDVPGYTWGTVTAMAQAGLKYLSAAPNYFDRIGTIMREWENKPFWWVGPDGQSKVLVWIPFWGYAMSHIYSQMSPRLVEDFYSGLEKRGYPYDVAYVRWSGHGDNAVPDPAICDFVRDWNDKYTWPHFIISGTSAAFAALEKRYGDQLSVVRGDWTPYWEDGAGSSARETALNRQSADRLVQAEALFALRDREVYPATAFAQAWKNVLLYSEHTWGADCSISKPESQKTREQWDIKQGYALTADKQSRELLSQALGGSRQSQDGPEATIQVVNTTSWERNELVFVPEESSRGRNVVLADNGAPMASQRLGNGELAFVAQQVPAFCARNFSLVQGRYDEKRAASAKGNVLDNGLVRVRLDEKTGGIVELTAKGLEGNLVDTSGGEALNDYLYLPGDDLKDIQRNGPVTIRVGEPGPVVASLIVESDAPGCKKLRREIRVVAGLDYVEVINVVDKARLQAASYHAKEGKESVNFAFPFQVPDGEMWLDVPLGLIRPEADQMPSACKNWFTVGRWADVANQERGITWVSLDAPLVEVGGITANLLNSQTNPDVWRARVNRTQKLYSWAMNNHWGTNYRAYQEGPTTFRFILRPHRRSDPAEASRFAIGFSQPLLAIASGEQSIRSTPLFRLEPAEVLVSALKPADSGKGLIVRLFNASRETKDATLAWGERRPKAVFLTNTSEKSGQRVTGTVRVPSCGLVTLRVEFE